MKKKTLTKAARRLLNKKYYPVQTKVMHGHVRNPNKTVYEGGI